MAALIAATVSPLISMSGALAEDKPAPTGYEHYRPETAKNSPKKAAAKCKDCQSKLDHLNAAIDKLNEFDKAHPKFRAVNKAGEDVKAAEKALEPDASGKPPAGKKKTLLEGAVKTAKAAETEAKKKLKGGKPGDDPPPDPADPTQLQGQLNDILSEIDTWSKALADCEAACPEKDQAPADKPVTPGDGPVKGGGGGGVKPIKLPAIPDCTQPNFEAKKEAFLTELGRLAAGISKVLGGQEGGGERKAAKLGEMDKSDPGYDELKKEVEELRAQLRSISDLQEKAEAEWAKKCPPKQGSMYIPGTPGRNGQQYATMIPGFRTPGENVSYSVPFATDSTTYCTFGEGTGVPGYTTATDDNGVDFPPSSYGGSTDGTPGGPGPKTVSIGNPKTPPASTPGDGVPPGTAATPKPVDTPTATTTDGPKTASTPTPKPSDTPVATTTENPKTVSTPTDTPVATTDKPNTPTTTDTPTPQTTTDDTPPVHITIYIKASEAVLDGSQTGEPIQGQIVKLVMREKPAVPTTAENKTDTGYDRPAPQCTTGASGECKVDVPPEDRPLYAMNQTPRIGGKPVSHFRLAINLMQHTGGIAETTGKKVPDLKDSMSSGNFTAELVKIGERTFVRLGFNTPYGATGDLVKKFSELLGVPVEIDICLVKEPGPPLGSEPPASYQAINQELPHAAIKLRPTQIRASIR